MDRQLVVCGHHPVTDVLDSISPNVRVKKIFITSSRLNFYRELAKKSGRKKIEVEICSVKKIDKLCKERRSTGVCAFVSIKFFDLKQLVIDVKDRGDTRLVVVALDRIQNKYNCGSIIRTCAAVGVDSILMPKDNSVDAATVEGAAGLLGNLIVYQVTNLANAILVLKRMGFVVLGCSEKKEEKKARYYQSVSLSGVNKVVLIFGNEGEGISSRIIKLSDYLLWIPMSKKIDSLNVAVAAGIILYNFIEPVKLAFLSDVRLSGERREKLILKRDERKQK